VVAQPVPAADLNATGDAQCLLDEQQFLVTSTSRSTYFHSAFAVLSQQGIDLVAHDTIEYDPAYERVSIHGMWRTRNGKKTNIWNPGDARIVASEGQADQRIYDGRLQLLVDLRDIRVGDVVETAWTLSGINPVMDGNISLTHSTVASRPAKRVFARLLWNRPQEPQFRSHLDAALPTAAKTAAGWEYTWPVEEGLADEQEEGAPDDLELHAYSELSSWRDWHQVAQWADTLFSSQLQGGPLFEQELKRFRALPREQQALAATRFVQDDIRYLGLEISISSHRPHSQEWVLERRFGDCKDKALLLVAFLRGLGFSAWPALVNTSWRGAIADWLPSAEAFDHAIVLAQIDGRQLWLDATRSLVRGRLEAIGPPHFARALVVDAKTTGLTEIPSLTLPEPTSDVVQSWRTSDNELLLTVTTRATHEDAIDWRVRLSEQPKDELDKSLRAMREQLYGTTLQVLSVAVVDDELNNAVTIVEKYSAAAFFDESQEHPVHSQIVSALPESIPQGTRRTPLAVVHPVHIRERIEVKGSQWPHPDGPRQRRISSPATQLDITQATNGDEWSVTYQYQTRAAAVLPEAVDDTRRAVKAMQEELAFVYRAKEKSPARLEDSPAFQGSALALVALTVATILAVWLLIRRRGQEAAASSSASTQGTRLHSFMARATHGQAESASSAVPVASLAGAEKLFPLRCKKGHRLSQAATPVDTVRLDAQLVTVLLKTCASCGEETRRYATLPHTPSDA
jgi:Domain of Unknown Function with PDB structure (DUF3857)/Transglutaminase-like superfamily